MRHARRAAVLLGLLPLGLAAAIPDAGLALDDSHLLRATQDGWEVINRIGSEAQPRLIPAFEADTAIASRGSRLAYVSRTRHGERRQLGCIAYDWVRGQVDARQDTRLLADATAPDRSTVMFDGTRVSCRLVGELCAADGVTCHTAEQEVVLGTAPGKAKAGKTRAGKKKHKPARSAGASTKKVRS